MERSFPYQRQSIRTTAWFTAWPLAPLRSREDHDASISSRFHKGGGRLDAVVVEAARSGLTRPG